MKNRDIDIVNQLENGSTLDVLSRKYGRSRQRISQIYRKETGKSVKTLLEQRNLAKRTKKEKRELRDREKIKFICSNCKKPVTKVQAGNKSKYCNECHNLSQNGKLALNTIFTCDGCGIKYHPLRNWKSAGKRRNKEKRKYGHFHSIGCYRNRKKE